MAKRKVEKMMMEIAEYQIKRRDTFNSKVDKSGEEGWFILGTLCEESESPRLECRVWWNAEDQIPEHDVSDLNEYFEHPLEYYKREGHRSMSLEECRFFAKLGEAEHRFLYMELTPEGRELIDSMEALKLLEGGTDEGEE